MNVTEAQAKIREITNTTVNDYSEASLVRDLNSEIAMVQIHISHDREALGFDDAFYSNLPVATFALATGINKYKITVDVDDNEIFTIHKVAVQVEDEFIDVPRTSIGEGSQEVLTSSKTASVPSSYYEIGQSIIFSEIPSMTGVIKVWFERAVSQVVVGDTTKILPVPSTYHNLVCYKTGFNYAIDKTLPNLNSISTRVQIEEDRMSVFEENRRDDEQTAISVEVISGL